VLRSVKEQYKVEVLAYVLVTGRNEEGRHITTLSASIGSPLLSLLSANLA
jgi:hypothetical protein